MDRFDLWIDFIRSRRVRTMAEVGVWRGEFAQRILDACPDITTYWLVDPWRNLPDWSKPLNEDDLEDAYRQTRERLAPHVARCIYLRGRTTEVAADLPELDFAYIDGDHTLRGIALDLLCIWPRIRAGGALGGDDFCPSIWQHDIRYEPSLVFPFAVHFAEGVNRPIISLPGNQFVIDNAGTFAFSDPMGLYPDRQLGPQISRA